MSFIQFFRILWARRWIVIAATVSCFLAAVAIGSLLPTRYTSTSRVMLDVMKPDPVTGQVMSTNFAKTYVKTQGELIRDYRVAGAVVDMLGWTRSPTLLTAYEKRSSRDSRDFRRWLAQSVIEGTQVRLVDGSNILEISYTATDSETARAVADAVRTAYLEQSLAFKRESAAKTADWYDQQVAKVRTSLSAAEARKAAFERANNIVLQDDENDIETARLRMLASTPQMPAAAMAAAAATSPAALQLAQLDAQIATDSQTLGPNHPQIQELRRRRAALAAAAGRERSAPIVSSGPSLDGQVQAQQTKVIGQRGKLEQLRRLQADVVVLRDQYSKIAAKAIEAHQQADANETGLTLLGSAVAPSSPVFPNWPLIIFGSIALGFGLGVLVSLITELLSRRVRGVEDLATTGVPVIAIVISANEAAREPAKTRLLPFLPLTASDAR